MRAAECPGAIRRKASSPCLGQDAAGRRGRGSTVNDALKNLAVGRVVIIKVPLCGTGCAVLPTLPSYTGNRAGARSAPGKNRPRNAANPSLYRTCR